MDDSSTSTANQSNLAFQQKDAPIQYCHKYRSNAGQREKYELDGDGDLINVARDTSGTFPEYVASRSAVTPKYLVHAKKLPIKFVCSFIC